jgi:hypothetical protein
VLDEDVFQITAIEEQWRNSDATFFKVRTTDGKHYVSRYHEELDQWTLQSDFDGAELFARPSIELITVEIKAIRETESQIVGCECCRPEVSELPFDSILAGQPSTPSIELFESLRHLQCELNSHSKESIGSLS